MSDNVATISGDVLRESLNGGSDLPDINKIQQTFYSLDLTEYVDFMKKGGTWIPFLHWNDVNRLLLTMVPQFSFEIKQVLQLAGKVVVIGQLGILCDDGGGDRVYVFREALGTEDEEKDDYGDAFTNAQANSFKRAAAQFGLGLPLYDKEERKKYPYHGDVPINQQVVKITAKVPAKSTPPKPLEDTGKKVSELGEVDRKRVQDSIANKMEKLSLSETGVLLHLSKTYADDNMFDSIESGVDSLTTEDARRLHADLDKMRHVK